MDILFNKINYIKLPKKYCQMASRLKINTLATKIEFIILSLGGKPDPDIAENNYLINKQESIGKDMKGELKTAREKLA